jgi:predicted RNA-binding protein with TRAM domain
MVHRRVRGGKFKIKFVEKPCPLELGQELDVNIIDLCPSGDGRSKIQGYTIVVPKAKPRESVTIKVTKIDGKTVFGEIVK